MSLRVGIDIGGTFTDLVAIDGDGRVRTHKTASTPHDYGEGIVEGLRALLADGATVGEVLHGTTVGSNTVLEGKGARTGLITTKGFRDILEIRDLRMPVLYDINWTKPRALVERRLRLEVMERVRPDGSVSVKLDIASVDAAIAMLREENVQSVAICLLHSYANPAHERAVAEHVRAALPDIAISVSHEILPEIKEYPRTSTTVINAYVQPVVRAYITALDARLRALGIAAGLQLMQSNGGLASASFAAAAPAHIIESGPAAGVVGGAALGRRLGEPRLITFDMGGTTAKAGLVENGEVLRSEAIEVGGGVMVGSRLLVGAGYMLKLPAIDLAEVRPRRHGADHHGLQSRVGVPGPGRPGRRRSESGCRGGARGNPARPGDAPALFGRGGGVWDAAAGLGDDDAGDPRGVGGARAGSSAIHAAGVRRQRAAVCRGDCGGARHRAGDRAADAGVVQRVRAADGGCRASCDAEFPHPAGSRRCGANRRRADVVGAGGGAVIAARWLSG